MSENSSQQAVPDEGAASPRCNVYVVLGCVEFETSTVMAAFGSRSEADAYIAEYQTHQFPERGPGYKANYDWYEALPVEVGVKPFDYSDLAQHQKAAR